MEDFTTKKINKKLCIKLTGYICLFFVIIITVASSILTKSIETDFNKPFTFTYYTYCFLVILILVFYIKEKLKSYFNNRVIDENEQEADIDLIRQSLQLDFSEALQKLKSDNKREFEEYSNHIVILLMFLWYFANAFYNVGLTYLQISFGNTLSNLSFLFILLEKFICFGKKCSIFKVVASLVAVSGLALIAINQLRSSTETIVSSDAFIGDIFILLGAFFYSIYSVLIKFFSKRYGDDFDIMFIFGFMGLYNLLLIPIFLFALSLFGGEAFEFPGFNIIGKIFLNAIVAAIFSDLLNSYAIILLTPHIVAFGLTLTIPLSILWDYLFKDKGNVVNFDAFYAFGTIFIFISFIIVVYESYRKIQLKKRNMTMTMSARTDANTDIFSLKNHQIT